MTHKDFDFQNLINEWKDIKDQVHFKNLNENDYAKSYLSNKNQSFIGYHQGYFDQHQRNSLKIKETPKIRANCKNYLEYLSNENGLIQINTYHNGHIDCIHQMYKNGNKNYLLPFSSNGGFYPTYTYVTVFEGNEITEEYAIENNHIIFQKYEKASDNTVNVYRVNYVVGGSVPVLEERVGIINIDTFEFAENHYDNWLNHRH